MGGEAKEFVSEWVKTADNLFIMLLAMNEVHLKLCGPINASRLRDTLIILE